MRELTVTGLHRRRGLRALDGVFLSVSVLVLLLVIAVGAFIKLTVIPAVVNWHSEQANLPTVLESFRTKQLYLSYPDGRIVPTEKAPDKCDDWVYVE